MCAGDGGNQGDPKKTSQNGGVPYGKILRINVNVPLSKPYGIPKDNPFKNTPGFLPAVFALGFRNPWRCSQDSKTKNIFCGDVGAVRLLPSCPVLYWTVLYCSLFYRPVV